MTNPRPIRTVSIMALCWSLLGPVPASAVDTDKNARAFLFVLEFALGAPLTGGQEAVILTELKKGWAGRSDEELRKFDAYPKLVEAIVGAEDPQALENFRKQLEASVREWLAESQAADPAVAEVRSKLDEKGKVLIVGSPALTAMAADAYGEIYAFSELLQKNPQAAPEQISAPRAADARVRLLKAWNGFSDEEKARVAATPGLWISLRSVLRYGSAADQAKIRADLAKLAAPARPSAGRPSGGADPVGAMIKSQVLLNVQAMTFNRYQFCHGFRSSIY